MEKEERSRSNEWVSHFSPVCLLISRVLEPERKREREREREKGDESMLELALRLCTYGRRLPRRNFFVLAGYAR